MYTIAKLRTLMLTLLAALGLGLGGMAHAGGDVTPAGGTADSNAPETMEFEEEGEDEWEDDTDDDWEDDDMDDEWEEDTEDDDTW
ncbi:hypothetical protein [Aquisalimonas sp.]|uniref:hypothetical protein n=1 Tax=Aquisalimonas sp. TaxID=1872621 RepID=UPI0025BC3AD6|nr:hypothetical protein [Aquisalimonas sp.]